MAVYRKRSTTSAPEALSSSYLMGSPPIGTSMMTLTSSGTFLPTGIWSMRMAGPEHNGRVVILLLTAVNHGGPVPDETTRAALRDRKQDLFTVGNPKPSPQNRWSFHADQSLCRPVRHHPFGPLFRRPARARPQGRGPRDSLLRRLPQRPAYRAREWH